MDTTKVEEVQFPSLQFTSYFLAGKILNQKAKSESVVQQ
jgi:hypothetical protein